MNRVLITGITGMAGSHLAEYVVEEHKNWQVFGVKRWRSDVSNIEEVQDKIQLLDCELRDPGGVHDLIAQVKPDYIFHLAAQSFVPESWKTPHSTISDNVLIQLNLFEAVKRNHLDPRILVALSSEEYGRVFENELPIKESNPLRPLSPYAVSKVTQDMLAYQYFESYGLKTIRTRAFNHEGPRRGEVFVSSNFAKQIAEIEAGLIPPVIKVGNLEAKRDWTDVRDMVVAYWLALELCKPGEDYVIASGKARSVKELLDCLLTLTEAKISVEVDESRLRPSDLPILQGDASKFKKETGWQTKFSFEKTMEDTLNYWRIKTKSRNDKELAINNSSGVSVRS